MSNHNYYVYFMSSNSGTLYLGVTNNLERRVVEHRSGKISGFSSKYKCIKLVYYEYYENVNDAIAREKEIKKWSREKKTNLIKTINPGWRDLYMDLHD